jgi:hypothetical protein
MSNNSPVFSPRLLIGFVGLAAGTFALSLYFLSQERRGVDDIGSTTYSRSALGYAGLAELLPKLGIPFSKSENNSVQKAKGGLLIIAEPLLWNKPGETIRILLGADKVLVVLPKWSGTRSLARRDWVDKVTLYSDTEPLSVLNRLLNKAELTRVAREEKWPKAELDRALQLKSNVVRVPKVESWTKNDLGNAPVMGNPVQLIVSELVQPIVASPEGILIGEIRRGSRRLWVLSDPDVLSNHGLGPDGKRNAFFAVSLINRLRGTGPAVFDETIHGFVSQPAATWRFIFEFPYVIVTLQGAVAVALLLWATMGRFGPPEPEAPPLAAGKRGLIDNVSRLIAFAGYQKMMLKRYVEATIRDATGQLHAPKGMQLRELAAWAGRLSERRGTSIQPEEVLARAEALIANRGTGLSSSAGVAKDIYRWKGELLNGPSGHPRDH